MKHLGSLSKSSGFYITIALIILSAVTSSYLVLFYKQQTLVNDHNKAKEAGTNLRAFSSGVIRFISDNVGSISNGTQPSSTAWLKSSSCGGSIAGDGYLPCSFPDRTPYGDNYTTTFSVAGGVVQANVSIPWPLVRGVRNGRLGALVARSASVDMGPISSNVAPVDPAMLGWLNVRDPLDTMANQRTEVIVATNVSRDIFLRTDGANDMDADLDMNSNNIVNVVNVTASGLITTRDLTATLNIQGSTARLTSNGVSLNAAGDLVSAGTVRGSNIESTGNISVGDPATTASTTFTFRQNVAPSEHVVLEAQTTASGGSTFNDLRVRAGDGGTDVDFIANNVYNEDINRYMSQGVYNMTVAKVGDIIPFPSCPSGMTEQIFTSVDAISYVIADPIEKWDIIPLRQANGWYLDAEIVTTNFGTIRGSDVKADITVTTKCL